jgi:hypothetical protein
MPRTLYSPRLSDDVVRALYQEARRRRMPMTRLADELITAALAARPSATGDAAHHAADPFPGKKAA